MGELIAGHDFDLTGRCVKNKNDGSGVRCAITWRAIADADESDLNKPGIAHYGNLNTDELSSIKKRRDAERAAIEAAMSQVCSP